MKPIAFHPEARLEADAAAAAYSHEDRIASRKFLDFLQVTIDEIHAAPQRWPFEPGTDVQHRHLVKYPFTIFYLNDLHEVFIVAVAHTSRRPGYWKSRIAG